MRYRGKVCDVVRRETTCVVLRLPEGELYVNVRDVEEL